MPSIRPSVASVLCAGLCLALLALPAAAQKPQKKQRDLLTRQEIMTSAHRDGDLFSALQSMRPHFLEAPPGVRTLGGSTIAPTVLYVDGMREGDLSELRGIRASSIDEVRYLDPSRAMTEYGPFANGGAVVVKMHRAPKGVDPSRDTSALSPARLPRR